MSVTITKGRTFADGETITPTKINDAFDDATVAGLGTMAVQAASAVAITGGTAALSIAALDHTTQTQETGYATGGAIALTLDGKNYAYIGLTTNATFTTSGQAAGYAMTLLLKNTTAGSLTLAWSGMTACAGVTLPTSLAAGAVLVVRLYAKGTDAADVFATYN